MSSSVIDIVRNNGFYVLVALAIFLLVQGLYLFYQGPIKSRLDLTRRLRATVISTQQQQALDDLLESRGLSKGGQLRYPVLRPFNEMVVRSGTTLGVIPIIAGMFGIAVLSTFLFLLLGYHVLFALPASTVIGLVLPIFALNFLTRRRINKFGDQLPDAIGMISRSLRVGHPLPVAIRMVGREMSEPIGAEFSIVSSELAAGLSLEQAIKNLEGRVGQDDLSMLVAAIVIQSDTGGNLGEILNVLATIMRNRMKLRRKVRALTSEGRISARALSALPFVLYVVLLLTAPDYYSVAWQDDLTKFALGGAAFWMLIGNIVMMNMVNIKY